MSSELRLSAKRSVSLGFSALAVCLGCSGFSAVDAPGGGAGGSNSDIGGTAGANQGGASAGGTHAGGSSAGERSAAGESSGGTSAGSSAGGTHAGGSSAAGTHAGGASAAGAAGSLGQGGKGNACDITECLIANTCLNQCGGTVVYTGCCSCVPPAVNKITCGRTD